MFVVLPAISITTCYRQLSIFIIDLITAIIKQATSFLQHLISALAKPSEIKNRADLKVLVTFSSVFASP